MSKEVTKEGLEKALSVMDVKVENGEFQKPVKKDILNIFGFAPSSLKEGLDFVAKNKERSEVWMLNDFYTVIGNPMMIATRWFEIHDRNYNINLNTEGPRAEQAKQHLEYLNAMELPVYMQDVVNYNDVKNATYFPAKEIAEFFGDYIYYTNTPSWLLAFAVYEALKEAGAKKFGDKIDPKKFKWKQIRVYGVDMAMGWSNNGIANEYAMQRPSCEWILGWIYGLKMAGIDVELYIPRQSNLLKRFGMYGYETADERLMQNTLRGRSDFISKKEQDLEKEIAHNQQEVQAKINQLASLRGSKAENDYLLSFT